MSLCTTPSQKTSFQEFSYLKGILIEKWSSRGYIGSTIREYIVWVRRYWEHCRNAEKNPIKELTRHKVTAFVRAFVKKLKLKKSYFYYASLTALRACSKALAEFGVKVPVWKPPKPAPFTNFANHLRNKNHTENTIYGMLLWLKHYHKYCSKNGYDAKQQLSQKNVIRFALKYASKKHVIKKNAIRGARAALHNWSKWLKVNNVYVPAWTPIQKLAPFAKLLTEYCIFRKRLRGVKDSSLEVECRQARRFLAELKKKKRDLSSTTVKDIDEFVLSVGKSVSLVTLANICTCLRPFFRFLYSTKRIPMNLAICIRSPKISRHENPPRGLPWQEVRRIINAIDQNTLIGKRDYAVFLLMASYGLASAEVRGLSLNDIDWHNGTLRIERSKTGVVTMLPLLGPVGEALASYIRSENKRLSSERHIFLRVLAPHSPISAFQLRCRFQYCAKEAGVTTTTSTHAFRHSHATRQVEKAAHPQVVSEILGHKNPKSLSVYVRVSLERLRTVSLPVPK